MTQFADLELIYNQFLNLIDEINSLIEKEEYQIAVSKLEHKDKLLKKLLRAKKTVKFTGEETEKINKVEQNIYEKEQVALVFLQKNHKAVGEELKAIKKKVKINTIYAIPSDEDQGAIIDISE